MQKRDHGGNLDAAMADHGGARADWLDLSTGINPVPYPLPALPGRAWTDLPTRSDLEALTDAARRRYASPAAILPLAGAQAAIQMIPRLGPPGVARVLGPTYNEHAACLAAAGWRIEEAAAPEDLRGAALAVLVNPNNPDGRRLAAEEVLALAKDCGRLIVDESFADPEPDLSVAPHLGGAGNMLVLRSFGKFYGLAGLRLGFALGSPALVEAMAEMAGPWPVSGAAIEIGQRALADTAWAQETTARLERDAARLDALAGALGWQVAGGTTLFRLYRTADAAGARDRLAQGRVWSRIFPWSQELVRLGLPAPDRWDQLRAALG